MSVSVDCDDVRRNKDYDLVSFDFGKSFDYLRRSAVEDLTQNASQLQDKAKYF